MRFVSRLMWATGMRSTQRTGKPYPVEPDYIFPTYSSARNATIFDEPSTTDISQARMEHLGRLGLPLCGRTVLDVGAGVGHLAQYFVKWGCDVTCVDGRPKNIERMRELYPTLKSAICDVQTEPLTPLGTFDIVFSYGLLYHLESPIPALRNMAAVCKQMLLLETQVCDHVLPVLRMEAENASADQALTGLGGRPSPSYVALILRSVGFTNIYAPKTPPAHRDFQFRWNGMGATGKSGHSIRCIFVASREKLTNENLVSLC